MTTRELRSTLRAKGLPRELWSLLCGQRLPHRRWISLHTQELRASCGVRSTYVAYTRVVEFAPRAILSPELCSLRAQ
ncbi:hypothetical protein ACLB2K_004616 [Fragaria x ananassa]